jgi:hypothetical protein
LRYTLKNRKTDEVYAVVMFTLSWGGELEEVEKEVDGEEEGSEDEFEDAEEGGKEEDKTEKKGKKSEDIPDDDEGVDYRSTPRNNWAREKFWAGVWARGLHTGKR